MRTKFSNWGNTYECTLVAKMDEEGVFLFTTCACIVHHMLSLSGLSGNATDCDDIGQRALGVEMDTSSEIEKFKASAEAFFNELRAAQKGSLDFETWTGLDDRLSSSHELCRLILVSSQKNKELILKVSISHSANLFFVSLFCDSL